jgi:uncharacterized protein (DUF433 family)
MKNLITTNPEILGGKPIIKGTRMSVESILELLASDMSTEEILKDYPILKKEHIQASIDYAAKLVGGAKTYFFETAKKVTAQSVTHEISRRR